MHENTDASQPVARTLRVLEFFARYTGDGASLIEVAEACGIAPATVGRIVKTLAQSGYLVTSGRGYVSNYRMIRHLAMPEAYLTVLDRVLEDLAAATEQSAEAIVHNVNELHWYAKKEHPNLRLRIRAQPGFRRSLMELDAISRLTLSVMPEDLRRLRYDHRRFRRVGRAQIQLDEDTAVELINSTDQTSVNYDLSGNIHGVRRFARLVFQGEKPLHLLCIAEAALMLDDIDAHVARNVELLNTAARHLEDMIARMSDDQAEAAE